MYYQPEWEDEMLLRELSQTKLALGGNVTLSIVTSMSDKDVSELFDQLWQQVFMFERRFSRFLPDSELSEFNRLTGRKTLITHEFRDLLIQAKQLGIGTGGLYNPFIIPVLQRIGYDKSAAPEYEIDTVIDYANRRVVSIDSLEIDDTTAKIPFATALDLGGCGKGYLADQLGKFLQAQPVQGYWLSLGGDIVTMGHDSNNNPITVDIQNANDLAGTTDWIIKCPKKHFAIATSGTFNRAGQNMRLGEHHIIDPITLKSAVSDIRLATVCADSGFRADVLASCAVILGSDKALSFLKKHGVKSALLQGIDKNGVTFEKIFGGQITKIPGIKLEEVFAHA